MYVESVTAKAFGPLRDEALTLKPGLNVIVGRNESAKSTWHAAIYAAICGRARRKGPPSKDDREFAEQYRPWKGDQWHVAARLLLDDGRRIEIHHELNQAVDCAALDLDLGRDVSDEIMHDGAPDASRWLGMNRVVFAATAVVGQAEILAVLQGAGSLQKQLEAAATHAGTSDPTATEAIRSIDSFKSEHVGLDRSNSTKPLRRAGTALEKAREALRVAQDKHSAYMALVSDAADLQAEADELASQYRIAEQKIQSLRELLARASEAEKAQNEADHLQVALKKAEEELENLQSRLDRATGLDEALGGEEPAGSHITEQLVAEVASALAKWNARQQPVSLHGPDAGTLQQQLDSLPPAPIGDVSVDPGVEAAASALVSAEVLARSTLDDQPAPLAQVDATVQAARAVGSSTLRNWAARLDSIQDVPPEDLQAARDRETSADATLAGAKDAAARAERDFETALQEGRGVSSTQRMSPAVLAGAAVAVVAGLAAIALFATGNPAVGGGLAAIAALAAVGAVFARGRAGAPPPVSAVPTPATVRQERDSAQSALLQAQKELLEAQSTVRSLESDERDAHTARADIQAKCTAHTLPADADSLRVLAEQVDQHTQAEQALKHWHDRRTRDEDAVARAEDALRRALQARGMNEPDVRVAYRRYLEDVEARARQAQESAKRTALEQALSARQRAERQASEAQESVTAAARAIGEAARLCGLEVGEVAEDSAADVAQRLETWQEQREAESRQLDGQRKNWTDFQAQLNGLTLPELQERTETKRSSTSDLDVKASAAESRAREGWSQLEQRAEDLGVALPEDRSAIPGTLTDLLATADSELESAATVLEHSRERANVARGERNKASEHLPSVPEAEEKLQACEAELQRVQSLSSTLDVVRRHLLDAQETVHRNIAPTLQKTLVEWLPGVTEDRYTDAAVDPETLEVKVKAGTDWVPASGLSFGTAEQIYLLLRVALVTHLADPDETCPMLLDDVTVQADETRTRALLETLATLASQRQMVLFAQESAVEQWAREQIDAGRNINLITLEQVPIG